MKNLIKVLKTISIILWVPAILFVFSIVYSRLNTDIGYSPKQPVEFSHKVHSSDYEIKCIFCHHESEIGSFSAVPTTFSCIVCHVAIKEESEKVKPLIESYDNQKPIQWIRLYKLPEHTHFNHNTHILAGIDCASCHGEVEKMEKTYRTNDFSMEFCLNCHRDPDKNIIQTREITGVFDYFNFTQSKINILQSESMTEPHYGSFVQEKNYEKIGILTIKKPSKGPENCSACHY